VALACGGVVALWLGYLSVNILLVIFGQRRHGGFVRTLAEPLMRYAKLPVWAGVVVAVTVVLGALVLADG